MESIAKKLKIALLKKDMNQKEFCDKNNIDEGNFSRKLKQDKFVKNELIVFANALGYNVKIVLIDQETGEEI